MTRRRVSNPLALAILGCLTERPMHPYEISTTLRERGKEGSIKLNYGSLYAVVESLQKHHLIEAQETTREGRRPERTVYAITPAGVEEFEDWLAELLSTPESPPRRPGRRSRTFVRRWPASVARWPTSCARACSSPTSGGGKSTGWRTARHSARSGRRRRWSRCRP